MIVFGFLQPFLFVVLPKSLGATRRRERDDDHLAAEFGKPVLLMVQGSDAPMNFAGVIFACDHHRCAPRQYPAAEYRRIIGA
ncbi:hypothetical protein D3C80_2028180 [compost metagenome]